MLSFDISKRYFLVDTENFKNFDFIDAFLLNEEDSIIIFASETYKTLNIKDLKKLFECKAKLSFKETENTKIAITSELLIKYDSSDLFFIVSDNPYFEILKDFINKTYSMNNVSTRKKAYLINTSHIQNFKSNIRFL